MFWLILACLWDYISILWIKIAKYSHNLVFIDFTIGYIEYKIKRMTIRMDYFSKELESMKNIKIIND